MKSAAPITVRIAFPPPKKNLNFAPSLKNTIAKVNPDS